MTILSKIVDVIFVVVMRFWQVISNKWVYRTLLALALVVSVNLWFDYYRLRTPVLLTWQTPWEERELKEKLVVASVLVETPEEDEPEEAPEVTPRVYIKGMAGYYDSTIKGCLGCMPHYDDAGNLFFRMANGQVLDDTKKTVALGETFIAYNNIKLGEMVTITNTSNGSTEIVEVTDTGRFDTEYGRVADMSVALRDALGCSDMCEVEDKVY